MLSYALSKTRLNEAAYVLWGTFLLFLTSQISIPLEPVPITLQTFGVMLIGLTFPRKTAIHSILTYLALGAVGVPVFANFSGGFHCLIGPTAGYLFGFIAAVVCMTSLRPYLNSDNLFHIAFNCLIGTLVILVFGITWLSTTLGIKQAIQFGLMPFIFPGIIKAILLALAVRYLKSGKN